MTLPKKLHSFRTRLFLTMIGTTLAVLLLSSTLLIIIVRAQLERNDRQEAASLLTAAETTCHSLMEPLNGVLDQLSADPSVSAGLKGNIASAYQVYSTLYNATQQLRPNVEFRLYDGNGALKYTTTALSNTGLPTNWGILRAASLTEDAVTYAPRSYDGAVVPALQVAKQVKDSHGSIAGYIVADLPTDYLAHLLGSLGSSRETLLVADSRLTTAFCSDSVRGDAMAAALRSRLLKGDSLNTEQYSYTVHQDEQSHLVLFVEQPRTLLHTIMRTLLTVDLMLSLVCVAVSIVVSLLISKRLFEPVDRLRTAMGNVEQGNLDTRIHLERKDELGELSNSFDHMVHRLKALMEQSVLRRRELDEARIRMMQAQLNPHFLCNTLDTMKWMAKINGLDDAARISSDLADILRASISPDEFTSLYEETKTLERYVEIQRIRFPGRFSLTISLPEELEECRVPKLMLQPLVENAILHGLDARDDGSIAVTVLAQGDDLTIHVTDDGTGIPEEVLKDILAGTLNDATRGKGHLGIHNVNTILSLHYGPQYGLKFRNLPEGGCRVTATLPITYQDKEDAIC